MKNKYTICLNVLLTEVYLLNVMFEREALSTLPCNCNCHVFYPVMRT